MEAALAFAAEVGSAAPLRDRADAWFLEVISRMFSLEDASYSQHCAGPRFSFSTTLSSPNTKPWAPTEHEWEVIVAENPFCRYVDSTGDRYFSARRVTDVVDMRTFTQTEFYELFDCATMPHGIQMRLPGEPGTHWTLEAGRSDCNFSDRDRLMLDALRTPLVAYESHRALAGKVVELQSMRASSFDDHILSPRKNEVLDLVAKGATNARIAEQLWISPGTVKKHLEHIYLKLEVGSRTAALAHTGRASGAPETREA